MKMSNITLGFPRMHFEVGEKRDFTPDMFKRLSRHKNTIVILEHGYGSKLGFTEEDYIRAGRNITFGDLEAAMSASLVTVIRTPRMNELSLLKKGSILFSMLHYPTHRNRNELLLNSGIRCLSMDSLTDDFGTRYIQDFSGTARNALYRSYELWKTLGNNNDVELVNITIIGTGGMGRVSANEAVHYAGSEMPFKPSVLVRMVGRNTTSNVPLIKSVLSVTDILVDTTLRYDTAQIIISNDWIGLMPEHSVITDITADDYDLAVSPVQVKAIEGIPTGNLDQTLFMPDDKAWDSLPEQVSSTCRRPVISCYSWPGADPIGCLSKYENQMLPFIDLIIENFDVKPDTHSHNPFERAMARAAMGF